MGAKILSFKSDRLTFKDSLCFLPFPLANFPTTFGIEELCKGFFPHKFNTLENQDYEGPMPDASYYDPDGMSSKKKDEFEQSVRRDGRRQLPLRHAARDGSLLRVRRETPQAGCRKFREECKRKADFDPMEKCVTIASACN